MPVYTVTNKLITEHQSLPADTRLEGLERTARGGTLEQSSAPLLGFVLDRSESMESIAGEAVSAFNALVDEQRSLQGCGETSATSSRSRKSSASASESPERTAAGGQQTLFSLSLFNDEIKLLYDALPIAEVLPLSRELYKPAGSTALNDAIGSMIQTIGQRARRRSRVLIAILTDGAENSSRKFSTEDILQMVTYRRKTYDWQFIFIGPPGSESSGLSIGIPAANITTFNADRAGIKSVLGRLSRSMKAYQLGDRRYALKLRNY